MQPFPFYLHGAADLTVRLNMSDGIIFKSIISN